MLYPRVLRILLILVHGDVGFLVLGLEAMTKDLGIRNDLSEEITILNYRLVDFMQLRFVTNRGQELLVAPRELVNVLPPAVIRG